MQPDYIEWIGGIGGVLTTSSFLPQVYKTWKTKSTESLSLPMLLLLLSGVCFWLVYGVYKDSLSLILSNLITLFSGGILVFFKLTYK